MNTPQNARPLIAAGTLLGVGMGGFVDGILFHQILQLHSMLSNVVPRTTLVNEQVNMFWDGIFHAFTWVTTAIGIFLLWRALTRPGIVNSGKTFVGAICFGWGLFNFVEGIIDHQLLQLHHVYQNGSHFLWDALFLGSGVLLIVAGVLLMRAEAPRAR